jgi:hypothetical protein
MEDIAAEISAVKAEISAVKTEIAGIKTEIAGMKSKRDEKGLSDPEQTELTTLTNKEIALTNEKAALTNEKVELLKRLPLPGIHSVSMPYFINNQ